MPCELLVIYILMKHNTTICITYNVVRDSYRVTMNKNYVIYQAVTYFVFQIYLSSINNYTRNSEYVVDVLKEFLKNYSTFDSLLLTCK